MNGPTWEWSVIMIVGAALQINYWLGYLAGRQRERAAQLHRALDEFEKGMAEYEAKWGAKR